MNYLRLGFTETTLLFYYYLKSKHNIYNKDSIFRLCNWLYSTSGFYDKSIKGSYFDFDGEQIIHSSVFNTYFSNLLNLLNNNNIMLRLCFHDLPIELNKYRYEFLNSIHIKFDSENDARVSSRGHMDMFKFIENQSVLIINNLSMLMKQQYESGNIKKICPNFPNVKNIYFYENACTFFNNGTDNSIFETADKICDDIKNINFDCAVISAGAYSSLLLDYIINKLNKKAYTIGGDLSFYFGIKTKRSEGSKEINEYFIEVPDNMKPLNYKKIEGGCYW